MDRNITCPAVRLSRLVKHKTDKTMWFQAEPTRVNESNPTRLKGSSSPEVDLRKVLAVMTVSRPPEGTLAKLLKAVESNIRSVCSTKVKLIERVGTTLKSQLVQSIPCGNINCPIASCMPCQVPNKTFDFKRRGVTYFTTCMRNQQFPE